MNQGKLEVFKQEMARVNVDDSVRFTFEETLLWGSPCGWRVGPRPVSERPVTTCSSGPAEGCRFKLGVIAAG